MIQLNSSLYRNQGMANRPSLQKFNVVVPVRVFTQLIIISSMSWHCSQTPTLFEQRRNRIRDILENDWDGRDIN